MKLIFEKSVSGRGMQYLPACDVEEVALPASLVRAEAPKLPEISETALSRHYTELNKQIGIAEGLKEDEYTADSWAKMEAALADAIAARESKDQAVVDALNAEAARPGALFFEIVEVKPLG